MSDKNLTFRLSPLAGSGLEEIWLYTYRQWSLEQADDYHHEKMDMKQRLDTSIFYDED